MAFHRIENELRIFRAAYISEVFHMRQLKFCVVVFDFVANLTSLAF
jgi:hypothetical protein